MYSLSDLSLAVANQGGPTDAPQAQLVRFLALIRPWIKRAGSALDVEETMLELGLPTAARGWNDLGENEVDLALAVAEYYNAAAQGMFKFTGTTVGAHQIGPRLGSARSVRFDATVPFQIAIDTGAARGVSVKRLTFGAQNATLLAGSPYDIDTVNAAVRTAGLLASGQDAIERGEKRVVIRPEFFTYALGATAHSSTTRNKVPYIDTTVNALADESAYSAGNSSLPAIGTVLTGGTSAATGVVLDITGNGVTGNIRFGTLTGTFQAGETITGGGFSATITAAPASTSVSGGAATINDYQGAVHAPASGWQYPNHSLASGTPYFATLSTDITELARWVTGGDAANAALGRTRAPVRVDSLSRVAAAFRLMAGFLEQCNRGLITSTTTSDDALRADLVAIGLPSSVAEMQAVAEYAHELGELAMAHCRLYNIGGGLLAAIAALGTPANGLFLRPHVSNLDDRRHIFVAKTMAMLAQIALNAAVDPITYAAAISDLAKLGWPSSLLGNAIANAQAMSKIDPVLWERYYTDACLIAGGYVPTYGIVDFSARPDAFNVLASYRDGDVYLYNPGSAPSGGTTLALELHIRVPAGLGANLQTGSLQITLPDGLTFSAAAFSGGNPDTVATITGTGTATLQVVFDHAAGYSGDKTLLTLTVSSSGVRTMKAAQARVSVLSSWLKVGSAVDYVAQFIGNPAYFTLELR